MNFKDIFSRLMLTGLIVLSLMSFIIITQQDNNSQNLITNNTLINKSFADLTTNLGSTQDQSDTASETFGGITPTSNFGVLDVTSIVSPTRIFRGLIIGTYNVLIALPAQFLGIPAVVIAVINAILILFLILGIWSIWKGVTG